VKSSRNTTKYNEGVKFRLFDRGLAVALSLCLVSSFLIATEVEAHPLCASNTPFNLQQNLSQRLGQDSLAARLRWGGHGVITGTNLEGFLSATPISPKQTDYQNMQRWADFGSLNQSQIEDAVAALSAMREKYTPFLEAYAVRNHRENQNKAVDFQIRAEGSIEIVERWVHDAFNQEISYALQTMVKRLRDEGITIPERSGEFSFRAAVKNVPGEMIISKDGKTNIWVEKDGLLVIIAPEFMKADGTNLGHGGRNRWTAYAPTRKYARHEVAELRRIAQWAITRKNHFIPFATVYDIIDGNLGTKIRHYLNSGSSQHQKSKVAAVERMLPIFHQAGVDAEGYDDDDMSFPAPQQALQFAYRGYFNPIPNEPTTLTQRDWIPRARKEGPSTRHSRQAV